MSVRALIRNPDDLTEFLLVRRATIDTYDAGLWELPGGKNDTNEDARVGVKREVLEETGLSIYHEVLLDYHQFMIETNAWITTLIFAAQAYHSNVVLNHEHDAFIWTNLSHVSDYSLSSTSDGFLLRRF